MADEQIGHAKFFLERGEQVQNPRLHRHIQRRHAFVGNDQIRLQGQRACDADALALTAGKFVGIPAQVTVGQADALHQVGGAGAVVGGRADAVDHQRFGDQIAHPQPRIQRCHRVLKHDLHAPPQRQQLIAVQFPQNLPGHLDPALMRHQSDQSLGDGRFAAAGFADQRERLATPDVEADMVHRVHMVGDVTEHAAAQPKANDHILQPCDRFRGDGGTRRAGAEARHGCQQCAGVLHAGGRKKVGGAGLFHHPAALHDDHPVGHLGHHTHVMGDQNDRRAEITLQIAQQIQHLALHGHVQRRCRFIRDQHLRAQRQRHRDHQPLAHSAGKFVRILGQPAFRL